MRGGLFPRWEQWKSNFVAYTVFGRWFPVLPHPLVSVPCFFHHGPYVSFSSLPIVSLRRFLSSLHSPSFYVLVENYGVYGESLWKRWNKSVSRTFLLELIQYSARRLGLRLNVVRVSTESMEFILRPCSHSSAVSTEFNFLVLVRRIVRFWSATLDVIPEIEIVCRTARHFTKCPEVFWLVSSLSPRTGK